MRTVVTLLLAVSLLTVATPVIAAAGDCGPNPPCCRAATSPSIGNQGCCPVDTCIDVPRERSEMAPAPRVDPPEVPRISVTLTASNASLPASEIASPLLPPDLHRRLASLSVLLI